MEIKATSVLGAAVQGLRKAGEEAGEAAARITDGDEIDVRDIVELKLAEHQFKASVKVFEVGVEMEKHLLDILA